MAYYGYGYSGYGVPAVAAAPVFDGSARLSSELQQEEAFIAQRRDLHNQLRNSEVIILPIMLHNSCKQDRNANSVSSDICTSHGISVPGEHGDSPGIHDSPDEENR